MQSIESGNAASYFKLAQQYLTQDEPAYCGIATLCMILNAAGIDPQRNWKGVWRWYDQDQLNCCRPLESIRQIGITMAEFICLARCNGMSINAKTRDDTALTLADFRRDVQRSCSGDSHFLTVSFSRKVLQQTGSGHFSPIAAYTITTSGEEWILVLDVARFKYPAYWCPLELMWQALDTVDDISGLKRGYAILCTDRQGGHLCSEISIPGDLLVQIKLNKMSLRALQRATKAFDWTQSSVEDLVKSAAFAPFSSSVELACIQDEALVASRAVEHEDERATDTVQQKQDIIRSQISMVELFACAYWESMTDSSGSAHGTEVREAIDHVKLAISALRSCCASEDTCKMTRPCCVR